MKKTIAIAAMLFISFTTVAQKESMLGKWIEQKRSYIDTLDAGRDVVNDEYEAYRSGQKKLDQKYIIDQEFVAADSDKLTLVIWEEKGKIYLLSESDLEYKFVLEPTQGNYFFRYYGRTYQITYDAKSSTLRLVNPEYKMDFYEFKSKA